MDISADTLSCLSGQWLYHMEQYVTFVANIPQELRKSVAVKVAIIDDGVNMLSAGIANNNGVKILNNIAHGRSFYNPPTESGDYMRQPGFYFSTSSHGTQMAQSVLQMCPYASLYIARLNCTTGDPTGNGPTTPRPTLESAIKVCVSLSLELANNCIF